ncbi:hypothetical protein [Arthrobacter sp. zg-Y877]|uniref:hypothetical protein n=1 Tax=Arthrobacter sp. zg-Y877 TaxID=3049074 RepID=UPI0025A479B3|nr:hypothetical protein [Arthrobacter sp. zg-Y877]MDM7990753.1 hypothetical protein [Arthrobacter sp. zg-Y877]
MGLMELELAQMEHRLRTAEVERRNSLRWTLRERSEQPQPGASRPEPEPAKIDWPLITLRFGAFSVALFRTVRFPAAGPSSRRTSSPLPG